MSSTSIPASTATLAGVATNDEAPRGGQVLAAATAFAALFSAVGIGLYGLTFFYDFFVKDYGWTRQQVTSGNAYAKLLIGPLFGYLAGWLIDRYGPRRLLLVGVLMAGGAMFGLGWVSTLAGFYLCYIFNALGYVFGGSKSGATIRDTQRCLTAAAVPLEQWLHFIRNGKDPVGELQPLPDTNLTTMFQRLPHLVPTNTNQTHGLTRPITWINFEHKHPRS